MKRDYTFTPPPSPQAKFNQSFGEKVIAALAAAGAAVIIGICLALAFDLAERL